MIKKITILAFVTIIGFTNICKAQQQIEKVTYNLSSIYSGEFVINIEAKSVSINWGDGSKTEKFEPNGKMQVIHSYIAGENYQLTINASQLTKLYLFGSQNELEILRADDRIPFYNYNKNRFTASVYVEKYYGLESINFSNCNNLSELGIGYLPMIKSIDCSNLPALSFMWTRHLEFIREINVTKNSLLKGLIIADDVMPENNIDLTKNPLLEYLLIEDFECPYLDISYNTRLKYFDIEGMDKLKQLKLADKYPFLKSIGLSETLLTAQDLNALFESLSVKTPEDCVFINIENNLGDNNCNRSIAMIKGYSFIKKNIDNCIDDEKYFDYEEYPRVN